MNKYSKQEIDSMRDALAESEWEGLKDRDLRIILMEGCVGWDNIPDTEIVEMYQNIWQIIKPSSP